ncbi:MAG: glycerate kinase [Halothiobacillus sp. 15-55-196]|jgi:glycerate kinase|uniref:glycerate kinase family protein n=1 Tax=Halothiobacillus sp. 15-55-196 TaxID=1970382 RepID=UPI000BD0D0B1|nr:glycerate kinase [Halothiobacillus sp. 15-55-196]OZB36584.1 MAG: glycerate kinase [Halothiobacillus sp. 15-55-196]
MGLRIVICPDSFKGSLSSPAVAEAMAQGARLVAPDARIERIPMADGGEGTAERITQALDGEWRNVIVHGPDGATTDASWGWIPAQNRAVIDVASACGLNLTAPERRDPWQLDSRGVGELLRCALDHGAEHILIGLGGSGTNDAGAGMLSALGVRFLDEDGKPLIPSPDGLKTLDRVDFSQLDARLGQIKLICLTDVDNPLTGPTGATAVFGPQKGLAATDIAAMDARLAQIAKCIKAARPLHCSPDTLGMGAAGGLGFALGAVLGARRQRGSEYLADLLGLDSAIEQADLVLTGEGALDTQTAQGKVVAEVIRRAQRFEKPVICIAGSVHITPAQIKTLGLWTAWPLCGDNVDIDAAISRAAAMIAERTAEATVAWLDASSRKD